METWWGFHQACRTAALSLAGHQLSYQSPHDSLGMKAEGDLGLECRGHILNPGGYSEKVTTIEIGERWEARGQCDPTPSSLGRKVLSQSLAKK